ncbi:uncharacterized protein LOC128919703 isoform X2 [Zeugodacus cucurbitae]|uniref:uncharacterized protein LOC128919703 isoform X2 n=1 Tax=Zeugodacus cucurbitae TaxID=28588 RepID=UPI000596A1B6|nr:uncharacterized protein LOC128919703 isoform X2 [Zeugodacus cucurbitae]
MRIVCLLMVLIIYIAIEAANIPINRNPLTILLRNTISREVDKNDTTQITSFHLYVKPNCRINHRGECIETSTIINGKYIEFESDNPPTTDEITSRQKAIDESSAIDKRLRDQNTDISYLNDM